MALKNRYDKTKIIKRPAEGDQGIPPSPIDKLSKFSVEHGSQRLLNALKREHPEIVDYFIRKNGNASGIGPSLPGKESAT